MHENLKEEYKKSIFQISKIGKKSVIKLTSLQWQAQSWTKCMRQTLISMWNSAVQESFNFYFSAVF